MIIRMDKIKASDASNTQSKEMIIDTTVPNMKIYMDVCCLNRPLDDQSQARIRIESEVVLRISRICQRRNWKFVGSDAVDLEIQKTPDETRKRIVSFLASLAQSKQKINDDVIERAKKITN